MHLSEGEVERFYRIWFPLLHFVNQHRKLVPSFPKAWRNASVSPEVAVPLRDVLWEDDALREAFIAENPTRLSQDDLALVESWQHRVSDNFFVFRHLKKYSVFIAGEDPVLGYGVLGITGPVEEVIGPYLPIYVKAVLIPFEDRIIYDSLLAPTLFTLAAAIVAVSKAPTARSRNAAGLSPGCQPTIWTAIWRESRRATRKSWLLFEKPWVHRA